MCRLPIVFSVICLLPTFACQVSVAQDGPFGGLLRDLIESELERRQTEFRDSQIPRIPNPQQQPRLEVTTQQRQVQGICNSFAAEAQRLAGMCAAESRRIAGLHNHVDEVQTLAVLAQQVSRDLGKPQAQTIVVDQLGQLDSLWRQCKYHLEQTRGLPNSFLQPIQRMDQFLTRGCEVYNIAPSINRRELVRLFESFSAELHHLERDLDFVRGNGVGSVLIEVRRLETRAHLLAEAVSAGATYDQVVAEYQAFVGEWSNTRRKIDGFRDLHLERTVEEIQAIELAIREQLWLPLDIDRAHFQHLTELAQSSATSFINSINLRQLLEVSQSVPNIMQAAGSLEANMVETRACVTDQADMDTLVEQWKKLDSAWRALDQLTRPIERGRTSELRLKLVSELAAMRQALGIQLIFDRREVIRYAAQLEGIADQQLYHVANWQRRPNTTVTPGVAGDVDRFVRDCRSLHSECARNVPQDRLYDRCNQITKRWIQLRPSLMNCQSQDRASIVRIADSATSCLVHLQTLLEM